MGKAKRNRGGLPGAQFPYERKFTAAEIAVITARQQRLTEAFRDAVGIQGWAIGLPEDLLQLLMFHGAMAGVDVDPTYPPFDPDIGRGAFIRPRRMPDQSGRYVDAVEWVLCSEDTPRERARDARREARAHVNALGDLDPEVREAIRDLFISRAQSAAEELHDDPEHTPDPEATP